MKYARFMMIKNDHHNISLLAHLHCTSLPSFNINRIMIMIITDHEYLMHIHHYYTDLYASKCQSVYTPFFQMHTFTV